MRLASPAPLSFLLLSSALFAATHVHAQAAHGHWSFDPAQVVARGPDIMRRAPDDAIDQLFQAVVSAARRPAELRAMCDLLAPQSTHTLEAIDATASGFGAHSRDRFDRATLTLLRASRHAAVQPYDPALAQHALAQAGVTAAILYDGFVAGINAQGSDVRSRDARCTAVRQLLDTVSMRPLPERAMIMRLLMHEGYAHLQR